MDFNRALNSGTTSRWSYAEMIAAAASKATNTD